MKSLFRLFLLLGAMFGLAGQSMAFASNPCATMQQEKTIAVPMAGMPDCAMGEHKSDNGQAPCKDMTPGCLAMTGCVALVAVDAASPSDNSALVITVRSLWPATRVLLGRDITPDPDPPSLLG